MAEPIRNIPLGLLAAVANPAAAPLVGLLPAVRVGGGQNSAPAAPPERKPFAGLFNTGDKGYTPADAQRVTGEQAAYWQRFPITPMWNGGKGAGGILPGIANFGSGFMGSYTQNQQRRNAEENERIRRTAAERAGGAMSLEDAVTALQGGTPEQSNAALSVRLKTLADAEAKQRERQRMIEDMQMIGRMVAPPEAPAVAPSTGAPPVSAPQSVPAAQPGPMVSPVPSQPPQAVPPEAGDWSQFLGTPAQLPEPIPAASLDRARPGPSPFSISDLRRSMVDTLPTAPTAAPQGAPSVPPQATAPQPPAATAPTPPVPQDDNAMVDFMGMRIPLARARAASQQLQLLKRPNKALDDAIAAAEAPMKAAAQERGKAMGTAQANLPNAIQSADTMIRNIDWLLANPDKVAGVTGWQGQGWYDSPSWYNPLAWVPEGTGRADVKERIRQVTGQAFVQAFQTIKGAGPISDQEGAAASAAITRLENRGQSDEEYQKAIRDARREIWELRNLALRKAGQQTQPYTPFGGQPGGVNDGFSIRRID